MTMSQIEPDSTGQPEPSKPERHHQRRWWLWAPLAGLSVAAISVAATLLVTQPGATEPAPKPSRTYQDPEADAVQACRDDVLTQLKAPATAQFPGGEEIKQLGTSSTASYQIDGEVDSENGFGALIRTSWLCLAGNAGASATLFD
jgi:hypothetical protein